MLQERQMTEKDKIANISSTKYMIDLPSPLKQRQSELLFCVAKGHFSDSEITSV